MSVEERVMAAMIGSVGATKDRDEGKEPPPRRIVETEVPAELPPEVTEETDDLADFTLGDRTYKVPKELKDAFMRNEDYTQKAQELSAQRQSLEQIRALADQGKIESAFSQSISAEQQEIVVIDAYLSQAAKMDWASMNTDQMLRAKVEIDNVKERKVQLRDSIESKRTKFQTDVKAKMDELRSKSRELASKAIPAFTEETEKAVRSFAQSEGLSAQEVDNVLLDPRSYKIIWKAMQFDKVQAGTTKAVEATTKALKPGAAGEKMPENVRQKLEYGRAMKAAKTSSQKANLIEDRLSGMFGRRG